MGFSSADSSSAAKGESVSDTIRTISCYADICAMRHPKEGAAHGCLPALFHPGHQCGRRRASASHPDTDGPDDDPLSERASGQYDHRPVRRPEIRPHSPLPDPRPGALSGHEVRTHLAGGAEASGIYPSRCAGARIRYPTRRLSAWRMLFLIWTCST